MRILEDEDSELEDFLDPLIQKLNKLTSLENPRNKAIKKFNIANKGNLLLKSMGLLESTIDKYC